MKPVFLILVLFTSAFAGAENRSPAGQVRTAEEGGVTVSAVLLNPAESGSTSIDFQITLDTHAGALPSDMLAFAKLILERGTEIAPMAWSGGKGGHHLSGKLSFPAPAAEGNGSLILVLGRPEGRNDMRFEWKVHAKTASNQRGGTR